MRATQAATNGARARAHLLIVAVAARSFSNRRVRLDLASVAEWLDRFAVPFLKRAQRASHAATNRARVRAHLLMVAVAAQHASVRVQFFRLTPAPPVRRLELALTRGALVVNGWLRRSANFRFTLSAGCPPDPTDRVQTRHRQPLFFYPSHQITTTNPLFPASFEQTRRVPTGHPDVCPCDVCGATNERN